MPDVTLCLLRKWLTTCHEVIQGQCLERLFTDSITYPLHLDPGLRRRLPGGIPVTLSVLIVIGVVLRLGHRASIGDFLERKKED